LELIKQFEGLRVEAYPDPAHGWGVPTIGYGMTRYADGRSVRQGDTITAERAGVELVHHVETTILPSLLQIPGWDGMHDRMRGALTSFAYNLGADFYGAPGFDTITNVLRKSAWSEMRAALRLYRNPGTAVEEGLLRRRTAEADEWEAGVNALAAGPREETAMSSTLRLTKGSRQPSGLYALRLGRWVDGREIATLTVNSGAPNVQEFYLPRDGRPGDMRPLPEAVYRLGPLEWAGGRGNYSASWGTGLGPTWIAIDPAPGFEMRRSAFGFHLDANRVYAPGSAGCVVLPDMDALRAFVGWYSDGRGGPTELVVDWGLGTVPGPPTSTAPAPAQAELRRLKMFAHGTRLQVLSDGVEVPATKVELFAHSGRRGANVNGEAVEVVAVSLDLAYRLK